MFAFYSGCLSAVTPPECLAVSAFAAAGFLVPFFFVYDPALLFQGTWTEIGVALVSGTVGVVALAAGLEGYFLRTAPWLERALFIAAALTLIAAALVLGTVVYGVFRLYA